MASCRNSAARLWKLATLADSSRRCRADAAQHARDGVVKSRRLDRKSSRLGERAFLVEKKSAIQRVQHKRHETRRPKQASRDVHHVRALSRLRGNRNFELRIKQMLRHRSRPQFFGILADQRLEPRDRVPPNHRANGRRELRPRKSGYEIPADARAGRCCAGARRRNPRSRRAPRQSRDKENRRDCPRISSHPPPFTAGPQSPNEVTRLSHDDRPVPSQPLPEPQSRMDACRRNKFRDRYPIVRPQSRAPAIRQARSLERPQSSRLAQLLE